MALSLDCPTPHDAVILSASYLEGLRQMAHVLDNGDVMEITPWCNLLGQFSANVLNIRIKNTVGTTVTDSLVTDDLDALLAPLYKVFLPTNCSYYGTKGQVVKPTRYDPITTIAQQGAGTLAGDCLPTQTAGLATLRTGLANRSQMGRVYFPASSEADNDASAQPSLTYRNAINTIVVALRSGGTVINGGDSVDWEFVVRSRHLDIETPVTAHAIRLNWATIRKRSHIGRPDVAPF